mgnify:CR=1 FL=1
MSLKVIDHQATLHNEYSYTVFRDTEWQEYRVKFYKAGEWMKDADYHTDDKQDALQSAAYWLKEKESALYK